MKLLNIGFGNMVSAEPLIAVVSPDSAPIKRLIQESRERGMLIDATYGRKTASVFIMDSDHVVLFDDETREMMKEIVRADALGRVFLATDYFDASINRISAWVTGLHSVQKALLYALLEPKTLKALQDANNFTELMVRQEELKTMPFGAVWEEYLRRETVPQDYFAEIKRYEADVLSKR